MKLAVEQESFLGLAVGAVRRCGLDLEQVELSDWWRSDVCLVSPGSPVFQAIEERPDLWPPAVVGIGAPDCGLSRMWAWAWIEPGPQAEEQLSWLLPRAQRRGDMRRDLRRSLAHDLRSPLGVVSGYCELLEEELLGELAPKQKKAVETIAAQSRRLLLGLEGLAGALMAPEEGGAPRFEP